MKTSETKSSSRSAAGSQRNRDKSPAKTEAPNRSKPQGRSTSPSPRDVTQTSPESREKPASSSAVTSLVSGLQENYGTESSTPAKPGDSAAPAPSAPAAGNSPTLRRGARGPEVRQLQEMLNQQAGTNLEVDGILGPRTEAAIRQLQTERNLDVDGIVGPQTWGSLNGQSQAGSNGGGASPATPAAGEAAPAGGAQAVQPAQGGTPGSVNHPPADATPAERAAHYTEMLRAQGVEVQPDQTYVIGLRGLSPSGERTGSGTNGNTLRGQNEQGNHYNDSFVVLRPGEDGQFNTTVIRGATYPGQSSSGASPDVNRDGRGDVGMIRPGTYQVHPNGQYRGQSSYHVRSQDGDGRVAGWRDLNQDGNYSAEERARSEARGDTLTEVLFHAGNDNRARSIGCQTMNPNDYNDFIRAVGGGGAGFSYTLIDASQG